MTSIKQVSVTSHLNLDALKSYKVFLWPQPDFQKQQKEICENPKYLEIKHTFPKNNLWIKEEATNVNTTNHGIYGMQLKQCLESIL